MRYAGTNPYVCADAAPEKEGERPVLLHCEKHGEVFGWEPIAFEAWGATMRTGPFCVVCVKEWYEATFKVIGP